MTGASARRRGVSTKMNAIATIARMKSPDLKSKMGDITMDNELLSAKIAAMEAKSALARRRSRR